MNAIILLDGVEASGAGTAYKLPLGSGWNLGRTFPIAISGISGDTVVLEGSIDGTNWVALDGASFDADIGATLVASFPYIRGNVTTYSAGTIIMTIGV